MTLFGAPSYTSFVEDQIMIDPVFVLPDPVARILEEDDDERVLASDSFEYVEGSSDSPYVMTLSPSE